MPNHERSMLVSAVTQEISAVPDVRRGARLPSGRNDLRDPAAAELDP
jgi:hypothetical protein